MLLLALLLLPLLLLSLFFVLCSSSLFVFRYHEQHKHYLKDGVEFWWNDEGETQYFTFHWWNLAQYNGLGAFDSNKRFFTINRSYSPGMARFGLTVWTGDISVSFDSLAQQPGYQINWLMAGASYVTCDTGGFNGPDDTPLLLTRWYFVSAFLGVMRVHSTHDDMPHFPFLYGPEAGDAMRKALELRYQMLPMHYSLAHGMYNSGRPVFRGMFFDYPADPVCQTITTQWMDGDHLLVSPVLSEDNSTSAYLPQGTWFEFNSTATHTGPTYVKYVVRVLLLLLLLLFLVGIVLCAGDLHKGEDYLVQ